MEIDLQSAVQVRLAGEDWRIIIDSARSGAENMAMDEAILESVARRLAPPTLRLYRWQAPTLSLGFAQSATEADLERITARGWDIVRRLTGGRAILHTDEITYSVALAGDHLLVEGTIVESYRRISTALLAGLDRLGLLASAEKQTKSSGNSKNPICFEVPSNYEIAVGGRKLVGSAQVRKHSGMLQHGTLPLTGDLARICDALIFPDEHTRDIARERVHERALTLFDATEVEVDWDQAAQALMEGFTHQFGMTLIPTALTDVEQDRTRELTIERYGSSEWTNRM